MDHEIHELEETIDLLGGQSESRSGGVSLAILVSFILHAVILAYFIATYRPVSKDAPAPPIAHYVELIRQNPQDKQFVEAPGLKMNHTPAPDAAFSNANRKAATPHPTGDQPTPRPGDGSRLFTPKTSSAQQQAANPTQEAASPAASATAQAPSTLAYRQPAQPSAASGPVNWRNAIKEVGKVASLGGGQQGLDRRLVAVRILQCAQVLEIRSGTVVALPQSRAEPFSAPGWLRLGFRHDLAGDV